MYRVQTFNSISDKGLTRFTAERYTVSPDTENADAILLRSHKLAPTALTPNLRAVARAGAGVNNVPVAECTDCLLYTSPSPRDATLSRMPSSA